MYWMDDKGKRWYWKEPKTAGECLNKTIIGDFLDDTRFAVAHNRAATLGGVDKESTHPFTCGNVIGVHNGTVRDWKTALPDVKATMDSQAIFEALENTDPEPEAVNEVLKKIDSGAYALVWHDMRVNELRMVRNGDRPLFILSTRSAMWFGSEIRMLEWALYRNTEVPVASFKLKPHKLLCVKDTGGEAQVHEMATEPVRYNSYGYKGNTTTYGWTDGKSKVGKDLALNRFDDYETDAYYQAWGGM